MEEEKKIVFKLEKIPLESERREIEERKREKRKKVLRSILCILFVAVGFMAGYMLCMYQNLFVKTSTVYEKLDRIEYYFNNSWLYKNDYEDLNGTLEDAAYYGMTNFPFDPYTSYMSAEEASSFTSSINMNFVGIGVQYSNYDDMATITRVFKDSPAEKAGIQPGDIIRNVDGNSVADLDSDGIKSLVVGQEGTPVTITVERQGKMIDIVCIRGAIDSTVYAEKINGYAVLHLDSFGDNTANECIKYLDEFKDLDRIIIDLRDNGGGYQGSVLEVAGLFLGKDKVVMRQVFNTGEEETYKTYVKKYYPNFKKIVLLTNGSTASAAEVFTACMKEVHENVTIVGETTYGKGVVQTSYNLGDGSTLKITVSKWLTPNGIWVNGEGIHPDVEVMIPEILRISYYAMDEETVYVMDDVSYYVEVAQMSLEFLGYDVKRTDGYFDESTSKALSAFQKDKKLEISGELDDETYRSIISGVIREWSLNGDKDTQMLKALEIIAEK